jgi:dTDP-4-dehydrorhamnose reductase
VKFLITGGGGMLAQAVAPAFAQAGHEVIRRRHDQLDVTRPDRIDPELDRLRPQWVIHLAALTRVDDCEARVHQAFAVNAEGAGNIARAAKKFGAGIIHLSTDYVFAGDGHRPYREEDPTGPLSVYGRSKLAGEQAVLDSGADVLMVRTSWLYGAGGTNFVDTILRKARAGEPLEVVDDQRGSPSWTADLARALLRLFRSDARGLFHCTNRGDCTWFELAQSILEIAKLETALEPTDTESLARPAPRPRYSALDCGKFERATGVQLPEWRDALTRYLASGA